MGYYIIIFWQILLIFWEKLLPVVYSFIFQESLVLILISVIIYLILIKPRGPHYQKIIISAVILLILIFIAALSVGLYLFHNPEVFIEHLISKQLEKEEQERKNKDIQIAQLQEKIQIKETEINKLKEQNEILQKQNEEQKVNILELEKTKIIPPIKPTIKKEKEVIGIKQIIKEVDYDLHNVRSTLGKVVSNLNKDEEKAINVLIEFLDDSENDICWKAAMLLFVSKGMASSNIKDRVKKSLIQAADKLDNYEARLRTIKTLEKLGGEEVMDFFIRLARFDDNDSVRFYAVKALATATIGKDTKQKKDLLLEILKTDTAEQVRTQAARSLKNISNKIGEKEREEIEKALILSMNAESENVKNEAIDALGELKSIAAVEPLLSFLNKESNAYIIQRIVNALINIDDKRAIVPLTRLKERLSRERYPDNNIRSKIEEWLKK